MRLFILFFLVFTLTTCKQKKSFGKEEYIHYLNSPESGMILTKEFNGIKYKLKMQPPAYLALSRMEQSLNTKANFIKETDSFKHELNFIFILEDSENSNVVKSKVFNAEAYGEILSAANTELKNDFLLIGPKDTLSCVLLHLEPANSLQPVLRLSLVFHGVDSDSGPFTLVYNDNIFNNGPLKFYYSNNVLENLPELKF